MRLLLDSHLPLALCGSLRDAGLDVEALAAWRDGTHRSAPNEQILEACAAEGRVFVTYDLRTVPPLLKVWAEVGHAHAGVVLIDESSIRPNDVGSLLRALVSLAEMASSASWTDRVVFLRARARSE